MEEYTQLQEVAIGYINGNISWTKDQIRNGSIILTELCDELYDMLSEEDYRLFLRRMSTI